MARRLEGPARYPLQFAIGNGAYGSVYRAKDIQTGNVVALKQVRIRRSDNGCPANVLREVAALKRIAAIGHDNLVKLLDVCYVRETSNLYLVFEHLDVDLSTCLQNMDQLEFYKLLDPAQTFRQILLGLAHLHRIALLHRDIKPANILLSRPLGHIKLADFGLTRVYTLACCLTSVVVTLWYRAPEVVLRTDYGTPIDLWSCGCVLAEMFLQKVPLFASETDSDVAQLKCIFSAVGLPLREEWPADAVVPYDSFTSWYASTGNNRTSLISSNNSGNDEENFEETSFASSHNNFDVSNLSLRLSTILPSSTPILAIDLIAKLLSFDPTRRLNVFEALDHPFVSQVSTHHGRSCEFCTQSVDSNVSQQASSRTSEPEEESKENLEEFGQACQDVVDSPTPRHHRLPNILRQGKRKANEKTDLRDSAKRTPVSSSSLNQSDDNAESNNARETSVEQNGA